MAGPRRRVTANGLFTVAVLGCLAAYWVMYAIGLGDVPTEHDRNAFQMFYGWYFGSIVTILALVVLAVGNLVIWLVVVAIRSARRPRD